MGFGAEARQIISKFFKKEVGTLAKRTASSKDRTHALTLILVGLLKKKHFMKTINQSNH